MLYLLQDQDQKKRLVYAPCEYHGLKVHPTTRDIDVFIAHNLFWEDPDISPRENQPNDEDSFEQMLEHSKKMNAKKIIITHIEEMFELSHDQLNKVFREKYPDYDIEASYDGMVIEL